MADPEFGCPAQRRPLNLTCSSVPNLTCSLNTVSFCEVMAGTLTFIGFEPHQRHGADT